MRDMSHAARGLHGRLAEAMAAVMGSDLLKSRFNPTGGVIHGCQGIEADGRSMLVIADPTTLFYQSIPIRQQSKVVNQSRRDAAGESAQDPKRPLPWICLLLIPVSQPASQRVCQRRFPYLLIARSSAVFRASSAASFFLR